MGALIYSTLPLNGYEVLADSGSVRDPQQLFVTRRRRILFHGSEDGLVDKFSPGAANSPGGGPRMLCSGPGSMELCPGTARDPHWEADVDWIGLHSGWQFANSPGTSNPKFHYRIVSNWSRTETHFPISGQNQDGTPFTTYVGTPFVSNPLNSLGGPTRARLINFIPMLQVVGVIFSPGNISPWTGEILALITLLNGNMPPPVAALQDWTKLPDPLLTYAKGFLTSENQLAVQGKWVPASLQSNRQLSVGDVHAFTLDLTWEQGKTPG